MTRARGAKKSSSPEDAAGQSQGRDGQSSATRHHGVVMVASGSLFWGCLWDVVGELLDESPLGTEITMRGFIH